MDWDTMFWNWHSTVSTSEVFHRDQLGIEELLDFFGEGVSQFVEAAVDSSDKDQIGLSYARFVLRV
jgi:hypothetical protein